MGVTLLLQVRFFVFIRFFFFLHPPPPTALLVIRDIRTGHGGGAELGTSYAIRYNSFIYTRYFHQFISDKQLLATCLPDYNNRIKFLKN